MYHSHSTPLQNLTWKSLLHEIVFFMLIQQYQVFIFLWRIHLLLTIILFPMFYHHNLFHFWYADSTELRLNFSGLKESFHLFFPKSVFRPSIISLNLKQKTNIFTIFEVWILLFFLSVTVYSIICNIVVIIFVKKHIFIFNNRYQ